MSQTAPVDEMITKFDFDIAKDCLVRPPKIIKLLKISRSTFVRWIKEGKFPKPSFYLAGRPVWVERHFKAWLVSCTSPKQVH